MHFQDPNLSFAGRTSTNKGDKYADCVVLKYEPPKKGFAGSPLSRLR